ncbi:hypothetical protein DEM27_27795 [Metarhizobium album]|uniref:IstB-like ATP-binding domain-containing protein n=1 Tax=Metarhizobium album TaxID=2182425 RepID=A0A2U2DIP1_9HYPH|nr:hypothetical protein DEM27_27795 [Rhizobium album]
MKTLPGFARGEREGRPQKRIRFFHGASLPIVDEIGCLPVVQGAGNLFFQLVSARYKRGAMIPTSSRGFAVRRSGSQTCRQPVHHVGSNRHEKRRSSPERGWVGVRRTRSLRSGRALNPRLLW